MGERRPSTKTVKKVLAWLEEGGLNVYGPNIDIEKRILYPGCRDFSADEAIAALSLMKRGLLEECDD